MKSLILRIFHLQLCPTMIRHNLFFDISHHPHVPPPCKITNWGIPPPCANINSLNLRIFQLYIFPQMTGHNLFSSYTTSTCSSTLENHKLQYSSTLCKHKIAQFEDFSAITMPSNDWPQPIFFIYHIIHMFPHPVK